MVNLRNASNAFHPVIPLRILFFSALSLTAIQFAKLKHHLTRLAAVSSLAVFQPLGLLLVQRVVQRLDRLLAQRQRQHQILLPDRPQVLLQVLHQGPRPGQRESPRWVLPLVQLPCLLVDLQLALQMALLRDPLLDLRWVQLLDLRLGRPLDPLQVLQRVLRQDQLQARRQAQLEDLPVDPLLILREAQQLDQQEVLLQDRRAAQQADRLSALLRRLVSRRQNRRRSTKLVCPIPLSLFLKAF